MSTIYPQKEVKGISFLISPNLGHPLILNVDSNLKNDRFQTDLLFISNLTNKEFENSIKNNLFLIPLLEYKWKLKLAIEKAKRELISKKKRFWGRWRGKRREKKLKKKKKGEDKEILKKLKPRAYRGDPISVSILNIANASISDIDDLNYEEYSTPRNYLIKHKVFQNANIFYKVKIEFFLSYEILEFLKHRNFVMLDMNHKINGLKNRINYHSIVISKQDWKNYTFVHATDLHIAERNDEIYGLVKNWKKLFGLIYLDIDQKDKKAENDKDEGYSENNIISENDRKPLKRRFINPNNQLRLFIKEVNRKVNQNKIDFIVMTGDLIDFSLLPGLPKELDNFYSYENSNWKIFKDILLNLSQKKGKGINKEEELLCPIFTIPGNHDYRPFHYDLRWGGLYRKMGLNATEAIALNDKFAAFPISAIIKSKKSLISYWSEINSSLDFYIKLGSSNFIFLNTGSDSFSNLADFISGHPSLTGLKKKQIIYLENLINFKIKSEENTFLFLHAPVINPKKQIGILKRFEKKFGKEILTKLEEFRESILKKLEKKTSKMRIDKKFNVRYGTISTNWEKIVNFCKEYCTLTLTGHTHALKEFRLGANEEEKKSKTLEGSPFNLRKTESPAAIYYDNYSEIYTNAEDLQKYGPFVVQTPALGFGGYHNTRLTGAYREVEVKNGRFSSFKVKYLRK